MDKFKKFLTVIFIILCFGIIIFCSYYIYSNINGDKIETTEDSSSNNTSSIDEIEANSFIEKFNYLSSDSSNNSVKLYTNELNSYDSLSDNYKYGLTMSKINYEKSGSSIYDYSFIYDKKEFNKMYHDLFGYDKDIKLEQFSIVDNLDHVIDSKIDFIHTCPMLYNGNDVYYAIYECGGTSNIYGFLYKVENTSLKEDTLEITFKSLIVSSDALLKDGNNKDGVINSNSIIEEFNDDCTYNLCKINFNSDEYTTQMKKEDTDIIMSKYSDKINSYRLTLKFDNEHNNYYFQKIEKIK